jgi:type III secretion protein W
MGPIHFDTAARLAPQTGPSTADTSLQKGSFRGEVVVPLQTQSGGISTDAMEEIQGDEPMQLMSAEEVIAYLDAAQQSDEKEKLVALAKRMLGSQGHPGAQAREQFGEATQQYLALQYALSEGTRTGADPARLEAIRDALADLDSDHGGDIRARLNTIGVASEQGADSRGIQAFQNPYADIALGAPSLSKTLTLALERFGGSGFKAGLQGLVAALGADLAATRPSTDPHKLSTLLQDLYQLEVVSTVLERADALSTALAQRHGHTGLSAERLVHELVGITAERWLAPTRFEQLLQQHGVQQLDAQIGLLTGVKALLREMPPRVFADDEARNAVLGAVQLALDELIAKEEAL